MNWNPKPKVSNDGNEHIFPLGNDSRSQGAGVCAICIGLVPLLIGVIPWIVYPNEIVWGLAWGSIGIVICVIGAVICGSTAVVFNEQEYKIYQRDTYCCSIISKRKLLGNYNKFENAQIYTVKHPKNKYFLQLKFQNKKVNITPGGKEQKTEKEQNVDDINKYFSKYNVNKISSNLNQKEEHQQSKNVKRTATFNPGLIISKGVSSKKELKDVEQLGEITLKMLNKYDCNNSDRRLLSLFGTVFDVTSAIKKYGPQGSYKEFAGHDITLSLGSGKLESKWLDKFVIMSDKQVEAAQGWVGFYETQYSKAGTLKKWQENQKKWPKLTDKELEELNSECIIM